MFSGRDNQAQAPQGSLFDYIETVNTPSKDEKDEDAGSGPEATVKNGLSDFDNKLMQALNFKPKDNKEESSE